MEMQHWSFAWELAFIFINLVIILAAAFRHYHPIIVSIGGLRWWTSQL